MIGKTLSHYKIIEKIGQGGMGIVYRAEDTNLSREVAIKVLPEQFTQDPQRLARFEREAKLLASLNHPNIAAIYGLEEADGVRFLALELVEGETLAEKVVKGPVPVEETLEVCRQIAEGVEAAHEKGVIHRDLKPANVKVTPEGKVKILDFGLAKAFEGEVPVTDISQSPTLTEEMTRAGVILGTAAYMSPEQARGEEVDKRTDIFAFGCVLYELLTGRKAFGGKTVTDTLAKVLEGVPEWKALPKNTPWRIQELLQRCLSKDPDERLFHIGEARVQIKKAREEPATESPTGIAVAVQPVQQRWGMTVGLVVLAGVVTGLAVWLLTQPSGPEQRLKKFVITPSLDAPMANTNGNELEISPDGRHFVYRAIGERGDQLYLRSLDDFVDKPIPGTEGIVGNPFFSADGESVAFFDGRSLLKISLAGGSPIALCDASAGTGLTGSWSSGDTIVFSGTTGNSTGLHRLSSTGGTPELLAVPNVDEGENRYFQPHILPDGENVLFSIRSSPGTPYQIAVISLETKEQKTLLKNGRQAHYLPTGHLVYELSYTGNLMIVPFDLARLEVTGEPVPILQGVRQVLSNSIDYAVSEEGTLVYVPGVGVLHRHRLVWVDRNGRETPVSEEIRDFRVPRVSPDGKRIAVTIFEEENLIRNVWVYDVEGDSFSRLTFQNPRNGASIWSPDSKWLVFQSGTAVGNTGLARQPVDRSRPQEKLTTHETAQMPNSWSLDGLVAFNDSNASGWDIGMFEIEGDGEPHYFLDSPANEFGPKFSPDGKWIAYVSDETRINQVYVRPYPGPDVQWLVSGEEGGAEPVWSPDQTELFYRVGNKMMVVSVQMEPTFNASRPRLLFEGSYVSHANPFGFQYYDISPDGRFLMMKEETAQEQDQINVVLNWFEELKRLVPTN